jgi:hypothetical protein
MSVALDRSGSVMVCGRIAVDQDHAVPRFAERTYALRAAVVELGRLADDDGPGAQDEDALQVGALGHLSLSRRAGACASAGPSAVAASRRGGAGRVVGRGGNIGAEERRGKTRDANRRRPCPS